MLISATHGILEQEINFSYIFKIQKNVVSINIDRNLVCHIMIKPTSVYVYLLVILVCNHSSNAAQCRSACKCVDEKIAELKGNLGYVGCFFDNDDRHFDTFKLRSINGMTLKMCREQCRGYIYVGLQNGDECFCGNELDVTNYPPKPDAECSRGCSGELNRKCGGPWRSSIYRVNI
ncbi:unnamed protein product [Mytilus edulis]|uniref:WSC domain-containing protein n=1 Tax=Mytilus edulis TaxID=6550 RepID=A0A8S3PN55_MYTED|nr:unnamed protein product [Mytilus edulis]